MFTIFYQDTLASGTLTINANAVLHLGSMASDLQLRHEFGVFTYLYGTIIQEDTYNGQSCVGAGEFLDGTRGGYCAGTIITRDCGNNDDDESADVYFAGNWSYNKGTTMIRLWLLMLW